MSPCYLIGFSKAASSFKNVSKFADWKLSFAISSPIETKP